MHLIYIPFGVTQDADAEGSIFHNATLREYKINTIHLLYFSNFLRTAFLIILFCLERCEFTGANLRGALLAAANLQSANLQGKFFLSYIPF